MNKCISEYRDWMKDGESSNLSVHKMKMNTPILKQRTETGCGDMEKTNLLCWNSEDEYIITENNDIGNQKFINKSLVS